MDIQSAQNTSDIVDEINTSENGEVLIQTRKIGNKTDAIDHIEKPTNGETGIKGDKVASLK